jgi:hypothetical protein
MRWRLIQEQGVEAVGIVLAKLAEKHSETVSIQVEQLPPEGIAGGRVHHGVQQVILVQGLDDLDRLHAIAGEPPGERQMQAELAFSLVEDPDGLRRGLAA